MSSVLLVTHIFLAIALVIVVLLQRPESGSLGSIGGGGNSGAIAPQASSANPLWRVTSIVGGLFMLTSLALALSASHHAAGGSFLDKLQAEAKPLAAPAASLANPPLAAPSPVQAQKPGAPNAPAIPSVPLATTSKSSMTKPSGKSSGGKSPDAKAAPDEAPSVPVAP